MNLVQSRFFTIIPPHRQLPKAYALVLDRRTRSVFSFVLATLPRQASRESPTTWNQEFLVLNPARPADIVWFRTLEHLRRLARPVRHNARRRALNGALPPRVRSLPHPAVLSPRPKALMFFASHIALSLRSAMLPHTSRMLPLRVLKQSSLVSTGNDTHASTPGTCIFTRGAYASCPASLLPPLRSRASWRRCTSNTVATVLVRVGCRACVR
jgi:hypothetical protein